MPLSELADDIRGCVLCPLSQSRSNAVPGEGPADAKLMVIGEAPGSDEDEQGRPFVGRAGKLLTDALTEAGIRREEVFITNVVKCRPPGNRPPSIEERETCVSNYLVKQMEMVNPRVICLLGGTAVQGVLKRRSVASLRGRVFERKERLYFVSYHPAAALYDAGVKPLIYSDIKKLKDVLENPQAHLHRKKGVSSSLDRFLEG